MTNGLASAYALLARSGGHRRGAVPDAPSQVSFSLTDENTFAMVEDLHHRSRGYTSRAEDEVKMLTAFQYDDPNAPA
jgi:hypothetical protein